MITDINKKNYEREVHGTNLPVVIGFYGPSCEKCIELEPTYEAVAQRFGGKLKFLRSNMYSPEGIAGDLNIKNVPFFVVLKNGEVVDRFPGIRGKVGSGGKYENLETVQEEYLEKRMSKHFSNEPSRLEQTSNEPSRLEQTSNEPSRLEQTLYFSENALTVIRGRYLARDKEGKNIETPLEMFERVAHNIASADKIFYKKSYEETKKLEKEFLEIMINQEFMPNSPTLMNAERGEQQLAACFVLPIEDDMKSIAYGVGNTAMIHKSGGGTGFSFGKLRPKNSIVSTTYGKSSGPITFMDAYDRMTEAVNQGGFRRGANMGNLPVTHPDIEEFIRCKSELDLKNNDVYASFEKKIADSTKHIGESFNDKQKEFLMAALKKSLSEKQLNNFNISVSLTDEFMRAVKENREYDLINPQTGRVARKEKAEKIFNLIAEYAWRNGEPGVIFIDRINEDNPTPALGKIESTNPCGEQPLLPYEACNLGSINLAKMIKNGEIDYGKLESTVNSAVRFLDNVIDMSRYPKTIGMEIFSENDKDFSINRIEEMVKGNRKIGLGIMGFADMLIKCNIPYDSEKALEIAGKVMDFIQEKGRQASEKLAQERGVFPNYEKSIYNKNSSYFKGKEIKLRNATITTIAPTGSISMIADASSGIEPLFEVVMKKTVMDGTEFVYLQPDLELKLKEKGIEPKNIIEKLKSGEKLKDLAEVPEDIRRLFATALDISPEWHLKMQSVFQKYTDNAVSKTINLPFTATIEDIKKAYMFGFDSGCKGLTVYRDGSREQQILTIVGNSERKKNLKNLERITIEDGKEMDRPEVTVCFTIKTPVGQDPLTGEKRTLYNTIGMNENGRVIECFLGAGKSGGDKTADLEAIGRALSRMLQKGIPPEEIAEMYKGIKGDNAGYSGRRIIHSTPDGVSQNIERVLAGEFIELLSRTAEAYRMRAEDYKKGNEKNLLKKEEPKKESEKILDESNHNPGKAIMFEKPECPNCKSKDYTIINQEGCLKYSCCSFSPKGCGG